jgi:hypothetical protein
MIGSFINKQACVSELKNQGFIWYANNVYINKNVNDVAQIYVYTDGSASALIGRYTSEQTQNCK